MNQEKIIAWGVVLLGAFLIFQLISMFRGRKSRVKKPRKAKKSLSFSLPKFSQRTKRTKQRHAAIEYELVIHLKNGEIVRDIFSDTQHLTRNEALEKHYTVEHNQLQTENRAILLSSIQRIQLEEKQAVDLFSIPDGSSEVSILDIPEFSEPAVSKPVLEKSVQQPVTSGSVSSVSSFNVSELKQLRVDAELTQKVLGERTGIAQKRISSIERGLVTPTAEELAALKRELVSSDIDESLSVENSDTLIEPILEALKNGASNGFYTEPVMEPTETDRHLVMDLETLEPDKPADKRKRKKSSEIPASKRSISKVARVALWLALLGMGASGGVAFTVAGSSFVKSMETEQALAAVKEDMAQPIEITDNRSEVDAYFSEFIPIYLNKNPDDNEARIERETKLKSYFSELSVLGESTHYVQKLKNFKLYAIEENETYSVAKYIVTFEVAGKDDLEPIVTTQLLNIPFISVDGLFAISEIPYFTPAPANKGVTELVGNNLTDQTEITNDDATAVKTFTEQFLTNYAASSLEDMQYYMRTPESLNGEYEYVSSQSQVYTGENSTFIVKTTAVFQLKGTEFAHKENMTLVVSKVDDKFFVQTFTHSLGGE